MILPGVGPSNPATSRSVVVLPHPDGPSSEKNSPPATCRSIASTATTSSKRLVSATNVTSPATAPPSVAVVMILAGRARARRRLGDEARRLPLRPLQKHAPLLGGGHRG